MKDKSMPNLACRIIEYTKEDIEVIIVENAKKFINDDVGSRTLGKPIFVKSAQDGYGGLHLTFVFEKE